MNNLKAIKRESTHRKNNKLRSEGLFRLFAGGKDPNTKILFQKNLFQPFK